MSGGPDRTPTYPSLSLYRSDGTRGTETVTGFDSDGICPLWWGSSDVVRSGAGPEVSVVKLA